MKYIFLLRLFWSFVYSCLLPFLPPFLLALELISEQHTCSTTEPCPQACPVLSRGTSDMCQQHLYKLHMARPFPKQALACLIALPKVSQVSSPYICWKLGNRKTRLALWGEIFTSASLLPAFHFNQTHLHTLVPLT